MSRYDLGTIGYTFENVNAPKATAEVVGLANAADTKLNPAAQRVIDNLRRTRDMMKQVEQNTTALNRSFTTLEIRQAAQRLQGFENALANSRQGMNNFGVVTQQAGYQIGDFLVQVQSGTNWMVAFGQQATQLVGVLPMMTGFMGMSTGALVALSAGLGIVIPLITALGAAWMRTTEDVANGGGQIEAVLKNLQQETDNLSQRWSELKFGSVAGQSIEDLKIQAAALRAEIEALTQESVESVLRPFINLQGFSIEQKKEELQLVIDRINVFEEELRKNEEKAAQLEKANAINEQMLVVELAHARAIGDAKREQEAMTVAAESALGKYSMMRTVAANVANELSRAADEAFRLAQQRIAATGLTYSGRGGDPRTANQQGYGRFVYTGPNLDANNNVVQSSGRSRREGQVRKEIELTKELTQAERERQTVLQSVQGSLESGFMAMVEGTESVKDAFKKMAYEIIKELYRVLVVQRMVGSFDMATGSGSGIVGILGGLFGGGRASGGSIMPNRPYLVGEHGPELVIPRHSGTVVNANQTANAMGGSEGFTQNLTISVTGSDAAMVRAEVTKMIPQITNATKAAVIDAKQRGGQMAAAFR